MHATTTLTRYDADLDGPVLGMPGVTALVEVLAERGVQFEDVLAGTGITPPMLRDARARLSHRQKMALFTNVQRLSPEPAIGLVAGQRQRISDFGVYGYGVVTSATFGEAVDFGMRHVRLAGPVFEKRFRVEGGTALFEGTPMFELGPLLPLLTEFWFSSIYTLMGKVLERPFEARALLLPYPAPAHAARYAEVLGCEVRFGAPVMQWQFDAALLALPLPNANPMMAGVCAEFCARMLESVEAEPEVVRAIKEACLASPSALPGVHEMAARLHLSPRTLHRRLEDAGTSYQAIADGIRQRLAAELLEQTDVGMDEIAERVGFSDVSNFRKAFRKWTGRTPAETRAALRGRKD
ncbi:AraC family transcriptional regulator [Variovorax sp. OV329]|uniref:AraC family transcriptional regulator n=1 Tax=Variovorax sp. OV329 TaxID=1882825 RepID=UPI0008DEBA00|nr:AraC family transcriptional regulator [Variovorax sp. OV329]SFN40855.1 transcriptional regulator, AraC family [Variovorax sp. OV329]